MNILIQVLSTLDKKLELHVYVGNGFCYEGISSAEPAAKYLISELAKQDECLDCIILLGTAETKEIIDSQSGGNSGPYTGKSAEGIYETKIREFVEKSNLASVPLNSTDPHTVTQLCEQADIDDPGYNSNIPKVEVVTFQGDSQIAAAEVLKSLEKYRNTPPPTRLFVDTQGGKRSLAFVLSVVLSMLRVKHIQVEEYYYTDFNRNNSRYPITKATREYRILDLASAFDDFIHHARGSQLSEYYKVSSDNSNATPSPTQKIVESITNVSKAISLCDTHRMPEEMSTLFELLNDYPNNNEQDALFACFVDDLKQSYVSIMDEKTKQINIPALIRWCVEKHLLQQALTLLYECMPEEYVRCGVLAYSYDDATHKTLQEMLVRFTASGNKELGHYDKSNLKRSPYHFLFKDVCLIDQFSSMETINESVIQLRGIVRKGARERLPLNFYTWLEGKKVPKLMDSVKQYSRLRELRNEVNHGNGSRQSYDEIEELIGQYLNTFQEISKSIENPPEKNLCCLSLRDAANSPSCDTAAASQNLTLSLMPPVRR